MALVGLLSSQLVSAKTPESQNLSTITKTKIIEKMPSNGKFGFSILVGNKELPEYTHPEDSSRVLVESILWAPVTYWLEIKEFCKFSGEIEAQKWPVTPYEIEVRCHDY